MVFGGFSLFQNPGVLAVAIGVLTLLVVFHIFVKWFRGSKGISMVISIILGLIAGWNVYRTRFYGWENLLAVVIYVLVGLVIIRIVWSFVARPKKKRDRFW